MYSNQNSQEFSNSNNNQPNQELFQTLQQVRRQDDIMDQFLKHDQDCGRIICGVLNMLDNLSKSSKHFFIKPEKKVDVGKQQKQCNLRFFIHTEEFDFDSFSKIENGYIEFQSEIKGFQKIGFKISKSEHDQMNGYEVLLKIILNDGGFIDKAKGCNWLSDLLFHFLKEHYEKQQVYKLQTTKFQFENTQNVLLEIDIKFQEQNSFPFQYNQCVIDRSQLFQRLKSTFGKKFQNNFAEEEVCVGGANPKVQQAFIADNMIKIMTTFYHDFNDCFYQKQLKQGCDGDKLFIQKTKAGEFFFSDFTCGEVSDFTDNETSFYSGFFNKQLFYKTILQKLYEVEDVKFQEQFCKIIPQTFYSKQYSEQWIYHDKVIKKVDEHFISNYSYLCKSTMRPSVWFMNNTKDNMERFRKQFQQSHTTSFTLKWKYVKPISNALFRNSQLVYGHPQYLAQRQRNNIVLAGDPGSGKSMSSKVNYHFGMEKFTSNDSAKFQSEKFINASVLGFEETDFAGSSLRTQFKEIFDFKSDAQGSSKHKEVQSFSLHVPAVVLTQYGMNKQINASLKSYQNADIESQAFSRRMFEIIFYESTQYYIEELDKKYCEDETQELRNWVQQLKNQDTLQRDPHILKTMYQLMWYDFQCYQIIFLIDSEVSNVLLIDTLYYMASDFFHYIFLFLEPYRLGTLSNKIKKLRLVITGNYRQIFDTIQQGYSMEFYKDCDKDNSKFDKDNFLKWGLNNQEATVFEERKFDETIEVIVQNFEEFLYIDQDTPNDIIQQMEKFKTQIINGKFKTDVFFGYMKGLQIDGRIDKILYENQQQKNTMLQKFIDKTKEHSMSKIDSKLYKANEKSNAAENMFLCFQNQLITLFDEINDLSDQLSCDHIFRDIKNDKEYQTPIKNNEEQKEQPIIHVYDNINKELDIPDKDCYIISYQCWKINQTTNGFKHFLQQEYLLGQEINKTKFTSEILATKIQEMNDQHKNDFQDIIVTLSIQRKIFSLYFDKNEQLICPQDLALMQWLEILMIQKYELQLTDVDLLALQVSIRLVKQRIFEDREEYSKECCFGSILKSSKNLLDSVNLKQFTQTNKLYLLEIIKKYFPVYNFIKCGLSIQIFRFIIHKLDLEYDIYKYITKRQKQLDYKDQMIFQDCEMKTLSYIRQIFVKDFFKIDITLINEDKQKKWKQSDEHFIFKGNWYQNVLKPYIQNLSMVGQYFQHEIEIIQKEIGLYQAAIGKFGEGLTCEINNIFQKLDVHQECEQEEFQHIWSYNPIICKKKSTIIKTPYVVIDENFFNSKIQETPKRKGANLDEIQDEFMTSQKKQKQE